MGAGRRATLAERRERRAAVDDPQVVLEANVVRRESRVETGLDVRLQGGLVALDLQQVVGPRREQVGIQLVACPHVLFGKNRAACSDAADDRQFHQAAGFRSAALSYLLLLRFILFVPITVVGLVVLVARYGGWARLRSAVRVEASSA